MKKNEMISLRLSEEELSYLKKRQEEISKNTGIDISLSNVIRTMINREILHDKMINNLMST